MAQEVGDPRSCSAQVLPQDEVKAVGEEEEGHKSDGVGAKLRGVSLGNDGLGGKTFDPGERGGTGEAKIIREEEEKILIVKVGFK